MEKKNLVERFPLGKTSNMTKTVRESSSQADVIWVSGLSLFPRWKIVICTDLTSREGLHLNNIYSNIFPRNANDQGCPGTVRSSSGPGRSQSSGLICKRCPGGHGTTSRPASAVCWGVALGTATLESLRAISADLYIVAYSVPGQLGSSAHRHVQENGVPRFIK